MPKRLPRFRVAPALILLGVSSCSSPSPKTTEASEARDRPVADLIEATNKPVPIGMLLAEFDASIRAWNNLLLTAATADDRRKARMLEDNLSRVTHQRRAEIAMTGPRSPLTPVACG